MANPWDKMLKNATAAWRLGVRATFAVLDLFAGAPSGVRQGQRNMALVLKPSEDGQRYSKGSFFHFNWAAEENRLVGVDVNVDPVKHTVNYTTQLNWDKRFISEVDIILPDVGIAMRKERQDKFKPVLTEPLVKLRHMCNMVITSHYDKQCFQLCCACVEDAETVDGSRARRPGFLCIMFSPVARRLSFPHSS